MNLSFLLPILLGVGAMFLLTRSQKKRQQQAAQMRDQMTPGTGVRTIGGMYATVKEIGDDTVTLEVAPGVHAVYAKNAVGAVLEDAEYNRIVHGIVEDPTVDTPVVPDDASSLTGAGPDRAAAPEPDGTEAPKLDLGKKDTPEDGENKDGKADGDAGAK